MSDNDPNSSVPTGPVPIILEAIVKRHCITATYNRGVVTMAPHILYTRHDELHLDAVALDRDGKPPRELKIGTYRLSGLGAITRIERPFYPVEGFDPAAERYQGTTLLAVDRT